MLTSRPVRYRRPRWIHPTESPGTRAACDLGHRLRESLPSSVREHLHCPVVDRLEPIRQKHTIEGLVTGAAE
ncbi:hypothetical protein AB0J89_30930 [Micromonospora chokoriensis]